MQSPDSNIKNIEPLSPDQQSKKTNIQINTDLYPYTHHSKKFAARFSQPLATVSKSSSAMNNFSSPGSNRKYNHELSSNYHHLAIQPPSRQSVNTTKKPMLSMEVRQTSSLENVLHMRNGVKMKDQSTHVADLPQDGSFSSHRFLD